MYGGADLPPIQFIHSFYSYKANSHPALAKSWFDVYALWKAHFVANVIRQTFPRAISIMGNMDVSTNVIDHEQHSPSNEISNN